MSMQASVTIQEVIDQIMRHKDCPGITAEQIKALCAGKFEFPFSIKPIIEAIEETEYYKQFGSITKETLLTLPLQQWKPIHRLFNEFS